MLIQLQMAASTEWVNQWMCVCLAHERMHICYTQAKFQYKFLAIWYPPHMSNDIIRGFPTVDMFSMCVCMCGVPNH